MGCPGIETRDTLIRRLPRNGGRRNQAPIPLTVRVHAEAKMEASHAPFSTPFAQPLMKVDDKAAGRTQHIVGAHIPSGSKLFPPSVTSAAALAGQWTQLQAKAAVGAAVSATLDATLDPLELSAQGVVGDAGLDVPDASAVPELFVGASLVNVGDGTDDGRLIAAITPFWRRVFTELQKDPTALHRLLDPWQFEEFIAGAYEEEGWERVILTPRSGDGGRDIIAYRSDWGGGIRYLDQVKLYAPNREVPANDVRALWGVLAHDPAASKAVFTTTSRFAPGVESEFADRTPTRIQLKDGKALETWLRQIVSVKKARSR